MKRFLEWLFGKPKPKLTVVPTEPVVTEPVSAPVILAPLEPEPIPPPGYWKSIALTTENFKIMWDAQIYNGVIKLVPTYISGSTRSGLVLSKVAYLNPRIRVTFKYTQSRPNAPAWECYWQLPYYKDLSTATVFNKNMNSIVPKPDGHLMMEVASAEIAEGWIGDEPPVDCKPGVVHVLETQIVGQVVNVTLNGKVILKDWKNPGPTKFFEGSAVPFGFYSEDAIVEITKCEIWTA